MVVVVACVKIHRTVYSQKVNFTICRSKTNHMHSEWQNRNYNLGFVTLLTHCPLYYLLVDHYWFYFTLSQINTVPFLDNQNAFNFFFRSQILIESPHIAGYYFLITSTHSQNKGKGKNLPGTGLRQNPMDRGKMDHLRKWMVARVAGVQWRRGSRMQWGTI